MVLEPLKVTIANFPGDKPINVSAPNYPSEPERGSRTIIFEQIVYIEQSDFKEKPEKGYKRLSLEQGVGLRHSGYVIKVINTNFKYAYYYVLFNTLACEKTFVNLFVLHR